MIKVSIKSFFFFKIKSFLNLVLNNVKFKYNIIGPFFLPRIVKKLTLLVSPHVDKNARDQLQIKFYKVIFYIKKFDLLLIHFLLKNKNIDGLKINFCFI